MVMALRALQPHTEERLADGAGGRLRRDRRAIEIDRAILRRSARRHQLAHPGVVRPIPRKLLPQPAMKFMSPAVAQLLVISQENIGPLLGPEVGVLRAG